MNRIDPHSNDIPLKALYLGWGFNRFELLEDVDVYLPEQKKTVTIPKGFQTDGRSSGIFFFIPRFGKSGRAALLHDYLYKNRENRKYSDNAFLEVMEYLNPVTEVKSKFVGLFTHTNYWPKIENYSSYYYVRLLGWILYLKK